MLLAFAFLVSTDPAADVLPIFQAKCASCHGPDVKKPKGSFGYILDLKRLAADKDRVEALRVLVASGNMPPRTSPTGSLSQSQKETIRDWIAGGCPEPLSVHAGEEKGSVGDTEPPAVQPDSTPSTPEGPTAVPVWERTLEWVGKFHLLVLHFPIALIVVASLLEVYSFWPKGLALVSLRDCIRLCVYAAAVFAVPTVVLGWLHAMGGYGVGQPGTLLLHRWIGTAAGAMIVLTAVLSELDARTGRREHHTRIAIFTAALVTAIGAHFGGTLVHGQGFLDW